MRMSVRQMILLNEARSIIVRMIGVTVFILEIIHVITGEDIEETPAKHFEKLLIKLMRIDRRFHVINRSEGERTFIGEKTSLNWASTGYGHSW